MEEELAQKFTVEDPYYREMLEMVKERKRQNKLWLEKQRQKKITKCMDDPESGKVEEKHDKMIRNLPTKNDFDECL